MVIKPVMDDNFVVFGSKCILLFQVRLEEEGLLSGARTTDAVEALRKTAGMLQKDIDRLCSKVEGPRH